MSQYKATASADVKPEIAAFFESFYKISDTPDAHEEYTEQFTKDAKLIMGMNEGNGRSEILKIRQNMWAKVGSRSHKPSQIFPAGAGSDDVMLYGTVDYGLKDGKRVDDVMWAARARMSSEDGRVKLGFYQVYVDSAAMSKAK